MVTRTSTAAWIVLALAWSTQIESADWPMCRYDTRRNAASPDALPDELHLQWSRQLPTPQPAWPNEPRLQFDAAYEPVVLGQRMFVASPNDGSVTAFETQTGDEIWRFFTNGPVRLAPVASKGKVYFGSDDGFLYCVLADDGSLVWKVNSAPADRGTHRHLGNARLVSFWPVRGGPVLADDVVYFGSGIWPTLGVFVHAVDTETGKLIWTNSNSHALKDVRIDHNYLHESGISPQGHMLINGDMLIVPNGRSMPARLDRRTGQMKYFVQGYRNGDSRVVVAGQIALVGDNGVVNLKDGREIGSRWASVGKDAPKGWSSKKDLFEGPMYPYKFVPGCNHRSVIAGGIAYGLQGGMLYAYDLKRAATSLYEKPDGTGTLKPARWDAPLLWKLTVNQTAGQSQTSKTPASASAGPLMMAGDQLYGYVNQTLFAVNLPRRVDKTARIAWTKPLNRPAVRLLAADDRLFIVTADGGILCYADSKSESRQHTIAQKPLSDISDKWSVKAKNILDESNQREGYAVVLGLSNGRLVEELLKQSSVHVIAVDEDADKVNGLRRRLAVDGPYSDRFQGLVDDPNTAALPPYLASLVVSEDADWPNPRSADAVRRIRQVLRPYGGSACFEIGDDDFESFRATVGQVDLPGTVIARRQNLASFRREGPLTGSADWTHETGDAARSFYSRDVRVKAPLGVLWYGDGRDHGFYKRKDYGHGVKPQVAGGRMFALQIATARLHAVDAYTGRLLWTRKVGPSARYVSMADAVYVADGRQCLVLNPATGEPSATYPLDVGRPAADPLSVTDIRVDGKTVIIAVRFNQENAISKGRWNSTLLVALDRVSGKQLWSRPAKYRYNTAAIAMAGERVFCVDSHSPMEIAAMRRRGQPVEQLPSMIMALDARTGKTIWQIVKNDPPAKLSTMHFMSLRTQDDWVAYAKSCNLLLMGKANKTYALNAKTGKLVWEKPMRGHQPLILGPETFINQAGHTYDVLTGKLLNGQPLFRRGGCNYAVGNKNLLFLRSNCAAYVDIENRQQYNLRNLRSGCSNSLIAADGLLNVPCFSVGCVCNYPIQTSFAMRHMPQVAKWHGLDPVKLPLPTELSTAEEQ